MELLIAENLVQHYGGLQVLQDISFSINTGETIALIGPNGAGKTTLLNVLRGLIPPKAGRIIFNGRDLTHRPPHYRAAAGIGSSFQTTTLFPSLSLLGNVLLAISGTKSYRFQLLRPLLSYADSLTKAQQLLESVDLWQRRHDQVSSLSQGEQRQVEILLAFASNPKLLLLDEPSAGLTKSEAKTLMNMIPDMAADTATIFSAHDLEIVFGYAKQIMVLYYGHIIAQGTPDEIRDNRRVQEIYLGSSK
jgi:branched-chain amino acid transport system ATP-binding protein